MTFNFGKGDSFKSIFNINVPCILTDKKVKICTDVVESEVSLLLSKDSMKKSDTVLALDNGHASVFRKTLKISCTDSGHYYISLTSPCINDYY